MAKIIGWVAIVGDEMEGQWICHLDPFPATREEVENNYFRFYSGTHRPVSFHPVYDEPVI